MTDDSNDRDIGVLREVSVLTDPRVADGPPTVTDSLALARDVRVLGPMPTVGDVAFAGRLGRRVARRRDRVTLTLVRQTLAGGDDRPTGEPGLPGWNPPGSATGTGRTPTETESASSGSVAGDRASRLFSRPRRVHLDASGLPADPGTGTGTRTGPGSGATRRVSGRPETEAMDDPPRRTDRGQRSDRGRPRPGRPESHRESGATMPTSRDRGDTLSGRAVPGDGDPHGDSEPGVDPSSAGGRERSAGTAPGSPAADHGTPAGADQSGATGRVGRQTADPVEETGRGETAAFARRLDRLTGSATAHGRDRHVAGEDTSNAEAVASRSVTGVSSRRPGSGERVAALHDVSVSHGGSPAERRTAVSTPPAETSRGTRGGQRRGTWDPTFRRRSSSADTTTKSGTEAPDRTGDWGRPRDRHVAPGRQPVDASEPASARDSSAGTASRSPPATGPPAGTSPVTDPTTGITDTRGRGTDTDHVERQWPPGSAGQAGTYRAPAGHELAALDRTASPGGVVQRTPVAGGTRPRGPAAVARVDPADETDTGPLTRQHVEDPPTTSTRRARWRPRHRVRDAAPRASERTRRFPERTVVRRYDSGPDETTRRDSDTGGRPSEPGRRGAGQSLSTDPGRSVPPTGRPRESTPADTPRPRGRSAAGATGDDATQPAGEGSTASGETTPRTGRGRGTAAGRPVARTSPVWHAPSRPGGQRTPGTGRPRHRVRDAAPRASERTRRFPERTVVRRYDSGPDETTRRDSDTGGRPSEPGRRGAGQSLSTDPGRSVPPTGRPRESTPADTPRPRGRSAAGATGDDATQPAGEGSTASGETTPRTGRGRGTAAGRPVARTSPVWHAPSRPGTRPASAAVGSAERTGRDPRVVAGHPERAGGTVGPPSGRMSQLASGRSPGATTGGEERNPVTPPAGHPLAYRLARAGHPGGGEREPGGVPADDQPSTAGRQPRETSRDSPISGRPSGTTDRVPGAPGPASARPSADDTAARQGTDVSRRFSRGGPEIRRTVSVGTPREAQAGTLQETTPGVAWIHETTRTGTGIGRDRFDAGPGDSSPAERPRGSASELAVGAASGPSVKRSGRDSQVGTSRIGALTEMPTLTHQGGRARATGNGATGVGQPTTRESPPETDSRRLAASGSQSDTQRWNAASLATSREAGSATRGARRESGSRTVQEATAAVPQLDAPEDRFPDMHVKRPAPRVDATHRESTPGRRHEQRAGESVPGRDDESRRGGDAVERAVEEAFFGQGSGLSAYDSDIDRVVNRLYREVERKMRIERERRGL